MVYNETGCLWQTTSALVQKPEPYETCHIIKNLHLGKEY